MKKVLILGGGGNQLPLIKAAKTEGYYVVLCDYDAEALGIKYCDKFYKVSIIDEKAVLEVAQNECVDGIVANTEAVMSIVASISEKLGLIGNPEKSIQILASKSEFREFQRKINLYAPKHYETNELKDVIENIGNFNFPVIVKPSQSSGSRGVTVIDAIENEQGIFDAFKESKEYSRNNKVIIEEYVDMSSLDEVEAEIFVNKGEILWDGLLLTLRNAKKPLIPMTDIYPLPYEEDKINIIKKDLSKIIKELGIMHGEYNAELYFTPQNKLFIMEINARQGGEIPPYVEKSTGIDMYKMLVTTAVGDNSYWDLIPSTERKIRYITHHPVYSFKEGKYVDLYVDEKIKQYIIKTKMKIGVNEKVPEAKDASSELGYIDFEFPNQDIQVKVSNELESLVEVVVD